MQHTYLHKFLLGFILCLFSFNSQAQSLKDDLQNNEYQSVVKTSLSLIAENPTSLTPYHYYGVSSFRLGHYQNSIGGFSQLLKLDPKSGVTYANRGGVYAAIGYDDLAMKDFNKSFKLLPKENSAGLNNRSILFMHIGMLKKARKSLEENIRVEGGSEYNYCNLSELYRYKSDSVNALHYAKLALSINPENSEALNSKLLLVRYKMDKDALHDFCEYIIGVTTENIERSPDLYEDYVYRAQAYDFLKKRSNAEADYLKALEILSEQIILFPKSYIFLYARGDIYQKLGNLYQANNDFRAAKRINDKYYKLKQIERKLMDMD